MASTFAEKLMKAFSGGHIKKRSWPLWEKICRQKSHINFSNKFGVIRAKILRTSKKLLAPTPLACMSKGWKRDGRIDAPAFRVGTGKGHSDVKFTHFTHSKSFVWRLRHTTQCTQNADATQPKNFAYSSVSGHLKSEYERRGSAAKSKSFLEQLQFASDSHGTPEMLPLQRNGQTNIKVQFPGSPNLPSQALGGIQTVILEKNNPSPNALKIADNPQRVTERMFVHETMEHFFITFAFAMRVFSVRWQRTARHCPGIPIRAESGNSFSSQSSKREQSEFTQRSLWVTCAVLNLCPRAQQASTEIRVHAG